MWLGPRVAGQRGFPHQVGVLPKGAPCVPVLEAVSATSVCIRFSELLRVRGMAHMAVSLFLRAGTGEWQIVDGNTSKLAEFGCPARAVKLPGAAASVSCWNWTRRRLTRHSCVS